MAGGRKSKSSRSRFTGRQGLNDGGQELNHHRIIPRSRESVSENFSSRSDLKCFSLRDEARNTERHHVWKPDQKLRHTQVNFISAGSSIPDELMVPQASAQQTHQETIFQPMPPQASLAGMTIEDQAVNNSDSQILGQESGRDTSPAAVEQSSLTLGRSHGQSMDGMFFMDGVGSPVALNKSQAPMKMPQSMSPTRSDSSEELIVFAGRKSLLQNSLRNPHSIACKVSQNSDHDSPTDHDRLDISTSATVRSSPTRCARSCGLQKLVEPTEKSPNTVNPKVDLDEPATEDLSTTVRLSRKGRRKQRRSKINARLLAEEKEILADYIEHMDSEDNLDQPFSSLAQNGALPRDLTDPESQINIDAGEIAARRPLAESHVGDSKITQGFNDDSNLDSSTPEDSDQSIDDAQIAADVQEYMDDSDDERDLLERKQARMTDEQIARLLSKQEEMGLNSSELLLLDGNDVEDGVQHSEDEEDAVILRSSAAPKSIKRARSKKQHQSNGAFSSAMFVADMLELDSYGEYDIMDHDRPSLRRTPKGRHRASAFELSDVELETSLLLAWEKDRSKKKIRKKEREELRAQGLLSGQDHTNLKVKYREGMSFGEVKNELIEFMVSVRQSLALPPMANKDRRVVHEMAHVLRLKSKSSGAGKARFPVLYKTGRTGNFDETEVRNLESLFNSQRFFPRKDVKGQRKLAATRRDRGNAGNTAGVSYRDGEVVGAAAPEIGIENRGRAMLEKMGWSKGTALGALNNKGMLQPVIHTVKTTKAGLG
ncbi:MAG: hypothetical protein Q9225_003187 [Loekoesia sp. 1 TL-2023]